MCYSIVIIEDQRMFRELLRTLFDSVPEFRVVGDADNIAEGESLCERLRPEVAVVDLDLPGGSGLELARRLRPRFPSLGLLAVTSLVDPITTTQVFESGFNGYIEKDQSPQTLVEGLWTVAEGGHYFTQLVRENRRRIFNDPDAVNKILSPREQEVIAWVCRHETSKSIAERMDLSVRTVENHRHRIIRKLSLDGAAGLVEFGQRLGFDRMERRS